MQKLSKRLQAVSGFVTDGNRVADIGTDHAYLPIYLVQSGRCPGAVAMDIRPGPLERAKAHIAESGLEQQIQVRLSDGLSELEAGEADSVVIAGMGGLTVIRILEHALSLLPHIKELILEPQSDLAQVRGFLREHRMYIDRENLVLEDGKYYPVLHVMPEGQNRVVKKIPGTEHLQRALDRYGECLVGSRHPVLRQLLERDEKIRQDILQSLAGSVSCRKNIVRRQELEKQLEDIRSLQQLCGWRSVCESEMPKEAEQE